MLSWVISALALAFACAADAALVQLGSGNFTQYFASLPADAPTIVEFYASWCPHCRHFAPTYEKLAGYFTEDPAPDPIVRVARTDCAVERELCSTFLIAGYPTVKVGPAGAVLAAYDAPKNSTLLNLSVSLDLPTLIASAGTALDRNLPVPIDPAEPAPDPPLTLTTPPDTPGSAAALPDKPGSALRQTQQDTASLRGLGQLAGAASASRLGSQVGGSASSAGSSAAARGGAAAARGDSAAASGGREVQGRTVAAAGGQQADMRDVVAATRQTFREMLEGTGDLYTKRAPFRDFWALVAEAHPVNGCRLGAEDLLRDLDIWWPQGADQLWKPPPEMRSLAICRGAMVPPERYHTCTGSLPDTRGYTCALWMLLHSLAAGVKPEDGAPVWMAGLRAFVQHFFRCEECQTNFLRRLDDPSAFALVTRYDAVVWMWQSHNLVNKRIAKEEAVGHYGDPKFPKVQFPTQKTCAQCWGPDGTADEAETAKFLMQYYQPLRGADDSEVGVSESVEAPERAAADPKGWGFSVLGVTVGPVRLLCMLGMAWCFFSCFCSFKVRRHAGRRRGPAEDHVL